MSQNVNGNDEFRTVVLESDKPVLVGVGVSNAEQAIEASRVADGVIMGASVVRRMIEGGSEAVGAYIREVRTALDSTTW